MIRAMRMELGLQQREFAQLLGISVSTVWGWENNRPKRISRLFKRHLFQRVAELRKELL